MKNRIYWWNQQKKWYLWFFAKQISLFVGRLHTPHKSHQVKWWFVQNFELDCIRSLEGCYWAKCTLLPLQKAFMGRDSSFCENIWGCNTIFDSHLTNNLRPPGYEAVSSTNRSHFGSDLCFLPPFTRRIFRCFRPALPAFFGFGVKSGSGYGNAQKRFHRIVLRCGSHQSGVADAALMLSRLLVLKLAVWKTHPFGTFLSINIG